MTRTVQHLRLSELKADPRNPKSHALDTINSSVTRFGFVEPIIVDSRTGLIVSGHGRQQVLSEMEERGDTPPDGITVDADGAWCVPVIKGWASRDDVEAAGALIAMNRSTELGGWVDESLLELLGELSAGPGLNGIGYDDADLEALRIAFTTRHDPEAPDEFPEYGSDIKTEHSCPACGYTWSGAATSKTADQ